jgi:exodeoxyribonuclease-1
MSYAFYDLETTGLNKSFDQIVQVAAIRTDSELNIIETYDRKARLLPHIIPSPQAMWLTGQSFAELNSTDRFSYYDMISDVWRTLHGWSPTVFLGFNSIRFDEELLRFAFYQNLFPAYLTNTGGNTRADILKLARAVAFLKPDAFTTPTVADAPSFKLAHLCAANGFEGLVNHDALADVTATHWLARRLMDCAPDLWSQFVRFANKAVASEFMAQESAFVSIDVRARSSDILYLTCVGKWVAQPNVHYCVDLSMDVGPFRNMSAEELTRQIKSGAKLIRRVKANASPLLLPLFELDEFAEGLSEDECYRRAGSIRSDSDFVERLVAAATASEIQYPASIHVEEQLYGFPFPTSSDSELMQAFHAASWRQRAEIVKRFEDARFRQLGRRILFFNRPDLLDDQTRTMLTAAINSRLSPPIDEAPPWLTIDKAQAEAGSVRAENGLESEYFADFIAYLDELRC